MSVAARDGEESTYEPAYGPPLAADRFEIAFKRRNEKACDTLLRRLNRFHPRPQ